MKFATKMMSALLALTMLLAIVACGAETDTPTEQTTAAVSDTTAITTTLPAETGREDTPDTIPEDGQHPVPSTCATIFPVRSSI